VPLLVVAFLPWSALAIAICAQRAGTPVWLSDLVHDVLPDSVLTRWSPSFPILAFTDGLLFAFALVEPLVQDHVQEVEVVEEPAPPPQPPVAVPEPREPVELRSS
jgi:hypothetical protein